MPVTPETIKQPTGRIDPAFFVSIELDDYLNAWIAEGLAKAAGLSGAAQDEAVASWVYYRAWDWRIGRLNATPGEMTVDSGRTKSKWDADQRSRLEQERDGYLDSFNAATGNSSATIAVGQMAQAACCPVCRRGPCCCASRLVGYGL